MVPRDEAVDKGQDFTNSHCERSIQWAGWLPLVGKGSLLCGALQEL